ncbi:MAG: heavy metal translocating P-type ATPase [Candidatus Methanomethylophilaceae archaeon]|nr:heavy metal translocating P-type ATPase [Candidatus Methanomethylophilaceae archaeon]MDD3379080.1 heavy metal translocating P-type ATPase [Candidatus Methanomethylophilaceae archaeon]MDY0225042.1 heavy metal translocating P-type ATPase [Candidatus Methanomethylophilaceae archaeon]
MVLEQVTLRIGGMSCAACASTIEKSLSSAKGVKTGTANFGNNTANIIFDETVTNLEQIIKIIEKAGYTVIRGDAEEADRKTALSMKINVIISAIFTIPLSVYAMGHMIGLDVPFHNDLFVFTLIQLLLCIPVMIAGRGFYIRGIPALINLRPNMDTLVALGTGTAFIYSLYCFSMVIQGEGSYAMSVAFDSAAMIITLVGLGKYLESRSKVKTNNAVRGLLDLTPTEATVIRNEKEIKIPTDELIIGDIVIIKPGEKIPADGIVTDGESYVNESMLTGESIPAHRKLRDTVYNGTVNGTGSFRISVEKTGKDTVLFQIIKMIETAQGTKAPVARIADRVAGVFVPIVILIAITSCLIWFFTGSSVSFSLTILISVLVISCPCALGLATPLAIIVGTGKGAQYGILFKTASALERSGKIDVMILDKTGTITEGHPSVSDVITSMEKDEFLSYAASAESDSEHPIGIAIVEYAKNSDIAIPAHTSFESHTGSGITCSVNGKKIAVGNLEMMSSLNISPRYSEETNKLSSEGKTYVYISVDNVIAGLIAVKDQIRPSSKNAVNILKNMNIETVMVTGDTEGTANAIAHEAGISNVHFGVLPQGKTDIIKEFQIKQKDVAMTGDGINDAPALTQANLGIAVGTGTDIAISSADVVLMNNDVRSIPATIQIGKATLKNVKENLFLAFCYNAVCIPIAAGLPYLFGISEITEMPMLAAAAMSLSSISVVSNALRLRKFKPDALKTLIE